MTALLKLENLSENGDSFKLHEPAILERLQANTASLTDGQLLYNYAKYAEYSMDDEFHLRRMDLIVKVLGESTANRVRLLQSLEVELTAGAVGWKEMKVRASPARRPTTRRAPPADARRSRTWRSRSTIPHGDYAWRSRTWRSRSTIPHGDPSRGDPAHGDHAAQSRIGDSAWRSHTWRFHKAIPHMAIPHVAISIVSSIDR